VIFFFAILHKLSCFFNQDTCGDEIFPSISAEIANETMLSKEPEDGGLLLSAPPTSTMISVQFSYFKSMLSLLE
jgi:hypothetical protein